MVYSRHNRPRPEPSRMPPASRASASEGRRESSQSGRDSAARFRPNGSTVKRTSKTGRPSGAQSAAASRLDLSARLRALQRALGLRVERRDALLDMVRAVNATLDPAKIADLIVDRASSWVPAPSWALVSVDQSAQLAVLAERGLSSSDYGSAVFGVAAWVMDKGEEFATGDLARDSRVTSQLAASVLAFPLSCRGRRVGALIALDPAPSAKEPKLAQAMLRAIKVLLEPASVALDNAQLLKRTEALSVTDDLTRLYNSRYLNLVLRRETKRASRSGRPLSLLFIDLDGFKSVNDTHGHLCGSRALVEAAAVIRGSARETDVVARFGGDEFALVLPDTGGEGAFAVGERILERIAAHKFLSREGLNIRLTASVGVATLPDVAASADELVQAADAAMYKVKDRGKNGIQAASAPADT
jgi:diguanylate cyclase (GGDEF)-like protein